MNWFTSNTERLLRDLISVQRLEIENLRLRLDKSQERCDRLTEALARKTGIDLIMPPPPLPPQPPTVPLVNPWKDPNPVSLNFGKGASK